MAGDQKPVDQKGFWAGFFGGAREAGIISDASEKEQQLVAMQAAATPLIAVQSKTDDDQAHTKEVADLRAQVTRIQAERITADAQAFAQTQITTGHAYAAEQAHLVALYIQAAQDDASHPLAAIEGSTAPVSRVDLLRTAVQARPANKLAAHLIENMVVLPNATGAADPYAEDAASAKAYAERANGNRAKA